MSITMNQRTFKVELFQGDDLDRLAELSKAAKKPKAPSGQATGTDLGEFAAAMEQYEAAAAEHDEFLAEAKARAVTIELKPMLRKDYHTLQVAHPPREDNVSDATIGVDSSTFVEPLLMASIVGPAMSDGERQEFLDSLNNAQFQLLADEALTINRVVFAPKDRLTASVPSPNSGETIESPASSTG